MTSKVPVLVPELLDFRNYLFLAFEHLGLPSPTKRQFEMAHYLQWGPKRLQEQAFRGLGKSIETQCFCTWCYKLVYAEAPAVRPEYSIKAISAAGSRAWNFSSFVLGLLQDWEMLAGLEPNQDGRRSRTGFDVGPAPVQDSPSLASLGITGTLTGGRGDLIVMDDVESLNNSATQVMRERLLEIVKEVDAVLKPIPDDDAQLQARFPHLPLWLIKQITGRVIVLGTPQTEETIYTELLKRGYEKRIWPARYPSAAWLDVNGQYLAPEIAEELEESPELDTGWGANGKLGKPTDTRFSETDLVERELSFGRSGFALQFMLDTSLADQDRYPLKISDLVVMDCDAEVAPEKIVWASAPDLAVKDLPCVAFGGERWYRPMMVSDAWSPYTASIMAIDPAGRGKDETSYACIRTLHSQIFLVEAGGFGPRAGYQEEVLLGLAQAAKRNSVNTVVVEANFGDGMFQELLKPYLRRLHPCGTEEVKHFSMRKELRICDTLEPVMNQHRLVIDPKVIKMDRAVGDGLTEDQKLRYQLFYQLSRMTREKGALLHDDRLDALAIAIAWVADAMALDVEEEVEVRKQQRIEEELQKFMDSSLHMVSPRSGSEPTFYQTLDPFRDD